MIKFTRAKLVVWAVLITAIYFLVAALIPPPFLIDALNGAFVGVALAVGIVYAPLVIESFRTNRFDRGAQLSIGIGLLWLSIILSRIWSVYYRANSHNPDLLQSPVIGFVVLLAVIGGCLFVTAPGYGNGAPEKLGGNNRWLIVLLGTIGAVVSIAMNYPGYEPGHTIIHFGERS